MSKSDKNSQAPGGEFPCWIVEDFTLKSLSKSARSIFPVFVVHAKNETGECTVKRSTIMRTTGIRDHHTVDKAIQELCQVNLLQKTNNPWRSSTYKLLFPRHVPPYARFPSWVIQAFDKADPSSVPAWAQLSPAAHAIYITVISCMIAGTVVELSRSELSSLSGIVRNPDITAAVKSLEDLGLLRVSTVKRSTGKPAWLFTKITKTK